MSNGNVLANFAARAYEALVPHRIRKGLHNRQFVRDNARWDAIRGTRQSLVRSFGGFRMRLYGDSRLCEMLYFDQFEPETRSFLDTFLRPGDVFLDVGANVGLYAIAAARVIGNAGQVHAFEPCSQTFSRLAENVRLNGLRNVQCHRLALSDSNAEAQLALAKDGFDAWNSLGTPYMGETGGHETVQTMALDSFATEHRLSGSRCTIKIDVEGWESQVLSGGREFLSRDDAPLLCVEFTEDAAALAGSSCASLYRSLENLGYEILGISAPPLEVARFPFREMFPNVNLLATKNPAELRARLGDRLRT